MDVETAFLNRELQVIYMKQPEGFVEKDKETQVCKLKKSLYGLMQSPLNWRVWDLLKPRVFHVYTSQQERKSSS